MCWVKLSLMYLLIGWWSVHTKTLKLLVLNRIETWCRIIHSRSSKAICSFLYHLHQIDILSGPNISSQSMWNYFHPFTPNDEIFVRLWKQMNRLSRVEWRHMVFQNSVEDSDYYVIINPWADLDGEERILLTYIQQWIIYCNDHIQNENEYKSSLELWYENR